MTPQQAAHFVAAYWHGYKDALECTCGLTLEEYFMYLSGKCIQKSDYSFEHGYYADYNVERSSEYRYYRLEQVYYLF